MGTDQINILAVNAGSSSIKVSLFLVEPEGSRLNRIVQVSVSNIGLTNTTLNIKRSEGETETDEVNASDYGSAIDLIIRWFTENTKIESISAIGHRIVHGGPNYFKPEIISDNLMVELESLTNFDPEHMPYASHLFQNLRTQFPNIPHVACFDTAFFHDLPRVAQLIPLPNKFRQQGLRRYGFHGLSYTYLQSEFRRIAGDDAANGKVIYAHLGSGVSLAATINGKPIDTTMGFTPASGLMMSSRSGDIDPGIVWYLQQQNNIQSADFNHIVNFESGLLGVSDLSSDMYSLLQNESSNELAADAVNLFIYQIKKTIGAFAGALDGLDSLILSGGIGEQSPIVRSRICDSLDYLGIEIDKHNNETGDRLISSSNSRVGVHVIPTDEAQIIAKLTLEKTHSINHIEKEQHGIS